MIREKDIQNSIHKFTQELDTPFQLKAVFFDMDGVLFDSMPLHAQAWFKTLSDEGIELEEQDPYLNEGSTALFTIRKMFKKYRNESIPDKDVERIKDQKHQFMSTLTQADVMPCMPELLDIISKQNIDSWVVTGSAQKILLNRLEDEFNGNFQFDKMITAHDVKIGKPNPEPYLMGMSKSGYSISESIVVENAPLGVQAAKAAGLFTIAINTGPLDPYILKEAGADIVFSGSEELLNFWPFIQKTINQHSFSIQK
jgi:HAD superfamily hydrolase (TIGR01509 family)